MAKKFSLNEVTGMFSKNDNNGNINPSSGDEDDDDKHDRVFLVTIAALKETKSPESG